MSVGLTKSANWIEAPEGGDWLHKEWRKNREAMMTRYGERFGFTPKQEPEPKVEIRYVAEPKPVDNRTPEEVVEDLEVALLVARARLEEGQK